jgi:hypothetical protein
MQDLPGYLLEEANKAGLVAGKWAKGLPACPPRL